MITVFFDRKNKRQVRSTELVRSNVWHFYAGVDDEGFYNENRKPGEPATAVKELTDEYGDECLYIARESVCDFVYKSPDCKSHQNWDMMLKESDLVFLYLEDET